MISNNFSKKEILLTIQDFKKNKTDSLKNINIKLLSNFNRRINNLNRGIRSDFSLIESYEKSVNTYAVELHKKISIPFACIIFIIIDIK